VKALPTEYKDLLAALERHSIQLQTAAEISRAASGLLDPDELMRRVVDLVHERFDLYYTGLFLVDQTGEWGRDPGGEPEPERWAVLQAGTGEEGRRMLEQGHKLEIGDTSMIGWCIAHRQARIALDVDKDTVRFNNPHLPETRSELALPLISRGKAIGAMTIQSSQPDAFSEFDVVAFQTMADQVANAITTAHMYRRAQREIIQSERMAEVLQQQADELRARNEELDAFAHTVAHDLKEPLSLIVLTAAVLQDYHTGLLDEDLQKRLQYVSMAADRMSNIIQELLLLAGVRKAEVEIAPLNMESIVDRAQARLTHLFEEHQAEITPPKAWPPALGHGPWVEEVWTNYLSNACKYGGHPLIIELGAAEDPGGMVRFWVRDNGPGLAPDEQERLFTPFTRLDRVRARGHGLGLSIVQRIVKRLGGQVGVESQVGEGSTFWFTLPASEQA
jgi:two-component system sensor histidine kinase/response regulator